MKITIGVLMNRLVGMALYCQAYVTPNDSPPTKNTKIGDQIGDMTGDKTGQKWRCLTQSADFDRD